LSYTRELRNRSTAVVFAQQLSSLFIAIDTMYFIGRL